MADFNANRRYSTLHSPDEPHVFSSLHTPIEPRPSDPFYHPASDPPADPMPPSPYSSAAQQQQQQQSLPFAAHQYHPALPQDPSVTASPPYAGAPSTAAATDLDRQLPPPQPIPAPGLSHSTHPTHQPTLSPHSTGTLSPHSTGSRTPHGASAAPASAAHSAHSSPPGSPGLPPLPGAETYMMTPQQAPPPARSPPPPFDQYQSQHPSSPPPAFNPLDPSPYDQQQHQQHQQQQQQQQQQRPPMPPEPIHTSSYNPSDASTGPVTPKTPVYTPGAAAGPNGGVHAPGQIGHPNQQHGVEEYHHGLCECFGDISTCCTGYWCPCILYSRTHHRLKTVPNSNLNDFSSLNGHCAVFCLLSPVSFVLTTLQRTRIRENYRLQGSVASDCAKAYCCAFCTLIQDDREVNHREDERRRFAGPGSGVVGDGGYRRQPTMSYP